MKTAKFSVGIDLGTTNSVLAYAELQSESPNVQVLSIAQIVAPNQIESFDALPSFLYIPNDQEIASGALALSSQRAREPVVGVYARQISAEQPERTVAAAKSWLCFNKVDRRSAILPWNAPEEVAKISAVEASRLILKHLVDAWQTAFPEAPLREQLVTLTVPASFDMAARELTHEAASAAGLPDDFVLLEEPQAAVYHWLDRQSAAWRRTLTEGDMLLVADIGGGTTDLTLVCVEQSSGELVLRRFAVGKHLLVGGDNMDLLLAHFAAAKFATKGVKLNAWQSVSLWHACRRAKESLLSSNGKAVETISVLGRGSRLIGGTVSIEVDRAEVQELLINGFFAPCSLDDRPQESTASGFQELGLPFEADTAVTRHIAAFLANNPVEHKKNSLPTHLLFNGGVFKASVLRDRLTEIMASWHDAGQPPKILGGVEDLDRAVACGAAFYGWAKRHGGVRIRGGTARSYYVGIESAGLAIPGMPRPMQALCVVPFAMEEGTELDVPSRDVGLVVGRPARFRFFASATRKTDRVGTVLRQWDEEELQETAPMELTLPIDQSPDEGFVPVRFHSRISELGVFELWCISSRDDQRWKLEFNVREEVPAP